MGTSFIPLGAIIAVLIIAFLFASLPQVNHKLNNKPMGTSFIPLSAIIAVLIIAFLFASLPHVNHKTRYRVLHNDLYNLLISDLGT